MVVSAIGYFALVINLYAMSLKGEYRLRIYSLIANVIYILYGYCLQAYPVIIGASLASILHTYRLFSYQEKRNNKKNRYE